MVKKISFILGFLSLFFLPNFYGIKLIDVFMIIVMFLFLLLIFKQQKKVNKKLLIGFIFISFFLIITVYGAIFNSNSYKGILVSLRFFILLVLLFIMFNYNKNVITYFKRGLVLSAYISTFWIFIDNIYYYTHGFVSINEIIFKKFFIGVNHILTNKYQIGDLPLLLRASGFGWDPGGIGPALLISYIINKYNKYYKYNFILILGIFFTISKTTILGLFLFWIYNIFNNINKRLSLLFIASFFVILFVISFLVDGSKNSGTVRHIKYTSSIFYLVNAPLRVVVLGVGYRGVGEFFYNYVPWMKYQRFMNSLQEAQNKVVESTFTNLFLYGGLLGVIIYFFIILFIILYGNQEERTIIIFLMVTFVGYTFENIWTNFLIYGIFLKIFFTKRIKVGKFYIG